MIFTLLKTELKRLFFTPLAWVLLAIGQLIIAWAFFTELEIYETLQSKLVATESPLGVTSLVIIPALLNGLNIIMLMTPLLTMRSIASERQSQRIDLLLASPASALQILSAKFLAIFLLLSLYWLLNLLQGLSLVFATEPDLGKILITWFAGLLIIANFTAAGLWLSSLTRHPVLAAISTLGLLIFLRVIGAPDKAGFLEWFSLGKHMLSASQGLLSSSDILFFLILCGFFLVLAWTRLIRLRSTQERWSIRVTVILLLLTLTLSKPALEKFDFSLDLSHNQQNTLSPATQELLLQLDQPLSMTVYVSDNPVLKKQIRYLLSRFQRILPDLPIRYIDPQKQPEAARTLGITKNGELLVRYQGRQQLVKKIDESHISKTIRHLAQRDHGWILNLQGHDEMDLLDKGLYGASTLTQNLQARGYQLRNFNLAEHGQLPVNTQLIVVSGAKGQLTEMEHVALTTYLQQGGNLLWLTDPDSDLKLSRIDTLPVIQKLPGVIVDATAAKLKLPTPDNAVITNYPAHDISNQITRHTLFPQAAALEIVKDNDWQKVTTLATGDLSWNETGSLKGEVSRDAILFEQQGPLTLASLLQRPIADKQQKIAFFGDSDFLRNFMLGQGDNLQLALNLFYWLSQETKTAETGVVKILDQTVTLSETNKALIGLIFLFLLPVIFALSGFAIPWLRKRRQ